MGVGGQYQTTTPKQWVSGFFAGTSANSNMLAVTNNQIKVSAIKLESSSSATYFTANSFEADLHDCIRYYFTSFNYQSVTTGVSIISYAYNANVVYFSTLFSRRMCKVPTVVPYSSSAVAGNVTNLTTGVSYPVATLAATAKGIYAAPTGLTATKGDAFIAPFTADARLA